MRAAPTPTDLPEDALRVVPLRRPWLWCLAAAFLIVAAWFGYSVLHNPNLDWTAVVKYQFAEAILEGLRITVVLTLLSAALGRGAEFDVTDRPLPPELRRLTRFQRGRRWVELNEANPTASAGDLFGVALLRAGKQLRQRLRRS